MSKTTWFIVLSAVALSGFAHRAEAEEPAADAGNSLTEIVVTAQRREQNLRDVPLTVTVAMGGDLATHNFTDPAQLQYLVPSLQLTNFQGSPGATNFSVRGIGTASFSHLVEPSVATVIDGVVMGRPEMGVMEFSDIERIEVLNGPQGMLFGKNASAGLINIVTAVPKIGQFSVDGRLAYENIDAVGGAGQYLARATMNAGLTDTSALRVSGFYTYQNALIRDVYPAADGNALGRKEAGFRAKYLWQPSDALRTYFSADFTSSAGMGTGAYTARSDSPHGPFVALDAASGIVPGPRNLYQSANAPTDLHFEVGGLQNETSYTFGEGPTLTNVAAWRIYRSHHDFDFDLRSVDILDTADARFNFSQVTEELRLTSPAHSPIDYQFGAFYYKGKSDRQDLTIGALGLGLPPPPAIAYLGVNSANNLDSKSYAGYGQGTFHLTDQLRLTVGGRYTHDDVSLYATQNDAPFVFSIAVPPVATFTPSQSANNFSWRISPQYDLGATTVAYVTVARGYKGPGYNLGWSGALPVGRETSLDYEAGIKSDIAANVQLNASVFWETFNNFQVQSFYQPSASYIVQNAGKSRSRGAEAQLAWRPLQSLKLTSAISYTEAVFTSFYGAPCYPGETAAQGCVGGQTNATGNSLSNAPRFTATVAADYTRDLTANLTGFLHADGYSRSTTNFSVNADPNTRQQGYQIGNASIALGSADEHWKASLYCRNCFDKRFVTYIESSAVGAPGDYNQSFAIDSFRVIGAAVDFKF